MNTILLISASTWLPLFVVSCFTRVKILRRILYYPLCLLTGGVVGTLIVAQTPVAPFADTFIQREFPGTAAATASVTSALSYLKNQSAALLGYKEGLETSGITDPKAPTNFINREEALANTNTIVNSTPPQQP